MRKVIVALMLAAGLLLGACSDIGGSGDSARAKDEKTTEQILSDLQKAHPLPRFDRSQLRQNLTEIVTSQAEATQTTTFFFNQGVTDPIHVCPSIGFPIPATSQLTNPEDVGGGSGDEGYYTVPQVEPTGIYTGETSATYAICVDANGEAFAQYWEGFINTVAAPATWDAENKRVELIGSPSFEYSGGE